MTRPLQITNNPKHEWQQRLTTKYVGECDADKLSKLIKKHDLLWCHDWLLMGYFFYLSNSNAEFGSLTPGETYYVKTRLTGTPKMIAEIWEVRPKRVMRKVNEKKP